MKYGILGLAALALITHDAHAGGGGVGVHYLCGSRKLNLSFQLDNRPEKRFYPKGTQVLVREPGFKPTFFTVTSFEETRETVRLGLTILEDAVPRGLDVEWLTDSIVDHIRIDYSHGMHRDPALDGKCTPLN